MQRNVENENKILSKLVLGGKTCSWEDNVLILNKKKHEKFKNVHGTRGRSLRPRLGKQNQTS